jgi:hypothetical protein
MAIGFVVATSIFVVGFALGTFYGIYIQSLGDHCAPIDDAPADVPQFSSEAVYCDGCGRDCRDEYFTTGRVTECDACNSKHFNCAIGDDMEDVLPSDQFPVLPMGTHTGEGT